MDFMSSLWEQNPKQNQRRHSFEKLSSLLPECRQETLIEVENLQVTVIKEPDAQTQSR